MKEKPKMDVEKRLQYNARIDRAIQRISRTAYWSLREQARLTDSGFIQLLKELTAKKPFQAQPWPGWGFAVLLQVGRLS